MGALMAAKPAEAAPPEETLKYLISLIEAGVGLLEVNKNQNDQIIALLQQIAAAPGGDGIVVTVLTPWKAREPEVIFDHMAIRAAGTYQSDTMVDIRDVKRLFIKAESSLDVAAQIQLIGNTINSFNLSTNVGLPAVCPANGNVSFGLAWGDWQPYIGIVITIVAPPTVGFLTIYAVEQE
ncbi:MAG: hypothetical protein Q8N51_06425 [Gammaproteobacteria bacterium]|nr:hypothetical protein [Gammaproteobacteria bacterium]